MEPLNRMITLSELLRFNGDIQDEKWIAYDGIVYDVSDCPNWRKEMHRILHFPGQDLSGEIADAPHDEDVFTRPCIKIVGSLV
ncbi:MAG: cytochrome b5 [Anaerolineales bacterium]|nr:cytochrome b5 [Anaerolineales bacterium]